jgi:hypothetical protein
MLSLAMTIQISSTLVTKAQLTFTLNKLEGQPKGTLC